MSKTKKIFEAHIVTLGNGQVGKTSIILRYIDDRFSLNYLSTIGIDSKIKKIIMPNGEQIKVKISDTAGQERFRSIASNYLKKANGILLVYDITSHESFSDINKWLQEINKNECNKPMVLIGNKCDLNEQREVPKEEGMGYAKNVAKNIPFYETSCKSGENIDKAIMDMESKLYKTGKSSTRIELQTHLETLRNLLAELKNSNQQLYDVNTFITCEDSARKDVKSVLKQEGFRYTELFARQIDAFISTGISMRDNMRELQRGIPTYTLAGTFPFVSSELQDDDGFYLGDNEYPVFVDFFVRNSQRVNSNIMIIGKSGSGKSFATKTLLANFAADNTKIFICDPEKEYASLCDQLHGKLIDVGSSIHGIINPFNVIRALDKDDEEDDKIVDEEGNERQTKKRTDDSFNQHLQFLEQFFRTILEGISSDAFEMINSLILEMYNRFHIDENTDLKKLKPSDYPTFDDLYALLQEKLKTTKEEFVLNNLRVAEAYIRKFAKGGRNSNLWNGYTSIETNENFVCFNFQSLIAGNNEMLTSAQMLLVFKYIESEVINNKDYNELHKTNRKIIVVVDEAHIFINPKYPIALNFMTSMAKRIRKYGGMQIVITQNINDFVGSEEIKRQSTAVINACQYSLIFSLSPNDVNDLVELYKNSGGINKEERNRIVSASVGQAFIITSPSARTMVQIHPLPYVRSIIESKRS